MELLLLKVCGSVLFRQSEKTFVHLLWSVRFFFTFLNKIMFVRGKFSFLYVYIWFDVQISREKQRFKLLIVFSPIFVADKKNIFG